MAKQSDAEVIKETDTNRFSTAAAGHGLLYGAAAIIILLLVFLAGAAIAGRNNRVGAFYGFGGGGKKVGGHMHRLGGGMSGTNGQTRTSGVVISVNGSSFTLAGHGSTTNVTTSSSTQYRGGNQVKQNDSVRVIGTMNSGSLQATQIAINP